MRSHSPSTRSLVSALAIVALAVVTSYSRSLAAENDKPSPKITYDDNVQAIFREHCLACHNQTDRKGDLVLESYAAALEGGGSGQVIMPGNLGGSRLWALVNHDESPHMPPEQDKLPQATLDVIRQWIEAGAPENAGSKTAAPQKAAVALVAGDADKPTGPPAMPEHVLCEPIVYTPKATAAGALSASPWAPLIAVAGQRQVCLYHADTAQLLGVLPFVEGTVHVLRFSRDGSLLLAGGGQEAKQGIVVVFDVRSGRRLATVGDELDVVLTADMSRDHSRIALGGPKRLVRIYSTADGKLLNEIKVHNDWVTAVAFSPDGKLLATADRGGGTLVWEADTAREHLRLTGHSKAVTGLSWRSDSKALAASGEDGTVRVWEMNNGKQIQNWKAHEGGALSVDYARDGRLITAGRDKRIKVWAADGKHLADVATCDDVALVARFLHDASRVVAGDWTGAVRAWHVETEKPLAEFPPNPPTIAMRVAATTARLDKASRAAVTAKADLAAAEQTRDAVGTNANLTANAMEVIDKAFKRAQAELTAGMEQTVEKDAEQAPAEKPAALEKVATLVAELKSAADEQAKRLAAAKDAVAAKQATVKSADETLARAQRAAEAALADKQAFDAAAQRLADAAEAATLHVRAATSAHELAETDKQMAEKQAEAAAAQLAPIEAEYQRLQKLKAEVEHELAQKSAVAQQAAQAVEAAHNAAHRAETEQQQFLAAQKAREEYAAKTAKK